MGSAFPYYDCMHYRCCVIGMFLTAITRHVALLCVLFCRTAYCNKSFLHGHVSEQVVSGHVPPMDVAIVTFKANGLAAESIMFQICMSCPPSKRRVISAVSC